MFAMPIEPVVALLMRQSKSSLTTMSDEIRQQIESLAAQHQLVERALDEKARSAHLGAATEQPAATTNGGGNKRALSSRSLPSVPITSGRRIRSWPSCGVAATRRTAPRYASCSVVWLRATR